ncbi:hypothetical protein BO70DRAFT_425736 [Aspergillus heteromorphus CBS 117.55]|uniref:Uncharacterized protein n=1 Tax=Aspergillus heteromorphus CBS 117.55 TaxID=1448321 RepID=A0A317WXU2_9EURO|nr:uncharacterized protein BO70DRAFT_425736 [Aspergillus heteromorphus CBS 117.55]PWY90795.1 hypothetical protein BO70DRAFT_425736 [Aspergillus heteromorphus CBS 117.55]
MAQNAVGRLFRSHNATTTLRQSVGSFTQQRSASGRALPHFRTADTIEVEEALDRLREELFVPFGVGVRQRRLMFRQKYAEKLAQEPVTASVGDEEVTLRPMNPHTLPTKNEAFEAIAHMKTYNDWRNLSPLLSGLKMSNRIVKPSRMEWIVRKAGEADALGVLLGCARRAKITGMRLNDVDLVQRIFFELHRKAQRAGFQGVEASKALSFARQFTEMMESPDHVEHDITRDPKRRPFVIGTLLELAAARALSEFEGKDLKGEVRVYAQRLLACWKLGNFDREEKDWVAIDRMLQENVPILTGMKLALQVKGVSSDRTVSLSLKSHSDKLATLVANQAKLAPADVQANPSLGLQQARILLEEQS